MDAVGGDWPAESEGRNLLRLKCGTVQEITQGGRGTCIGGKCWLTLQEISHIGRGTCRIEKRETLQEILYEGKRMCRNLKRVIVQEITQGGRGV